MGRGDVEKAEFVGTRGVIDPRLRDRIAGIGQIDEVDALDDPSAGDVEARDHADPDAHARATLSASFSNSRPS
jgi:hypothetical protein